MTELNEILEHLQSVLGQSSLDHLIETNYFELNNPDATVAWFWSEPHQIFSALESNGQRRKVKVFCCLSSPPSASAIETHLSLWPRDLKIWASYGPSCLFKVTNSQEFFDLPVACFQSVFPGSELIELPQGRRLIWTPQGGL